MSDIGINFPPDFVIGLALLLALPVTSAIMVGLDIAWRRIRRRDPNRRLTALKWSAIAVFPCWLAGLSFGGMLLADEIKRAVYNAHHYFALDRAAEIDGITLPAGTRVTLDDSLALQVVGLPEGATLTLRGATWQGKVEFTMPAHTPDGATGRIARGTLAAPATIQNIPCQSGHLAMFFRGNELMECTLSQAVTLGATIDKPDGVHPPETFRCRAGDTIQMDRLRSRELAGCRLAESADFGEVVCAAGERILMSNGYLARCSLAKSARFGPIDLPTGATVDYYEAAPSSFKLPIEGAAVDGFGLNLPAGTDGSFCYHSEALQRLEVDRSAYVAIAGIKLTGSIDFDCGPFRSGTLFEDTIIGGKWRRQGELVLRAELFPDHG